jgi:hypothetical protein
VTLAPNASAGVSGDWLAMIPWTMSSATAGSRASGKRSVTGAKKALRLACNSAVGNLARTDSCAMVHMAPLLGGWSGDIFQTYPIERSLPISQICG